MTPWASVGVRIAAMRPSGRLIGRLLGQLPRGWPLPEDVWRQRHHGIVTLLWLHAVAMAGLGDALGHHQTDGIVGAVLLGVLAGAADLEWKSRRLRSGFASVGLLSASSLLVHLSGGYIEMHFHFFVALAVISLY